jgi:hypothetical protein
MVKTQPPRTLSYTAKYFLNRLNDPTLSSELRMWGHALLTTELREVSKKNLIAENQRKQYLRMVISQLHLCMNKYANQCIFF